MLVILHALQDAFGYVPEPAPPMIASASNLSRAELHGVLTFYHDFRRKPSGRHVLSYAVPKPVRPPAAMRWRRGRKRTSEIAIG